MPDQIRVSLDYYKNNAIHLYVAEALVATSILTSEKRDRATLEERALTSATVQARVHLRRRPVPGALRAAAEAAGAVGNGRVEG